MKLSGVRDLSWLPAAAVGAITAAAWLNLGIYESPIFWDHAYFTYLAQSILRGEPMPLWMPRVFRR